MNRQVSKIIFAVLLTAGVVACKKSGDDTQPLPPLQFQAVTFKFGADSTAFTINSATQVIKNMPRGVDVKTLAGAAVLPAGYSINPNPATAQDYTKGVTYTIANDKGQTYTLQITAPAYDAVNNPYGIYNAKQLSDIRKGLTDGYVLMNDIQLPDLTAANSAASVGISDYDKYGWYSIGTRYLNGGHVVFRGTLDGQNHTIKNLSSSFRPFEALPADIDAGRTGKGCEGLFGYAIGATFKNIAIQLAPSGINALTTDNDGYGNVGSLVGLIDSSTITNCSVSGNASVRGIQYIGGLIGKAQNSTITKCVVALTSASGSYAIVANSEVGGLLGWAFKCDLTDCSASGSVIGSGSIGGLLGTANTCNVKTSSASGNLTEVPNNIFGGLVAPNSLGGLIGSVSTTTPIVIQNCFATGAVAGSDGGNTSFHRGSRIGGLLGNVSNAGGSVTVANSYAAGAVSRVYTNTNAPYYIGALAGNTPNGVFVVNNVCTNYWDKTTTGQTALGGANGNLVPDNAFTANGKTTAEMKATGTFANWDFSGVWNVAAGTNNGYPFLRSTNK